MSDIFVIFPELVRSVFADNCVAGVFLVAVICNLVLPKDISIDGAEVAGSVEQQQADAEALNDLRERAAAGDAAAAAAVEAEEPAFVAPKPAELVFGDPDKRKAPED